jgi:ribosomal protein S18 acetylase RimI-like enzyme
MLSAVRRLHKMSIGTAADESGAGTGDRAIPSIRPAVPGDAEALAFLLREAAGPLADPIFGFGEPARTIAYLRKLARGPGNLFSYDITHVAQVDGRVVGMSSGLPARAVSGRSVRTALSLLQAYGPVGMIRLVPRLLALRDGSPGAPERDYHLVNLAVAAEWRGAGIGSMLVERVHLSARREGFAECSLTVINENDDARRLYHRLGYRQIAQRTSGRLLRLSGVSGMALLACRIKEEARPVPG